MIQVKPYIDSEQSLIEKLRRRDVEEFRFSELFEDVTQMTAGIDRRSIDIDKLVKGLRDELTLKDKEIDHLREVVDVKDKQNTRLNDELISLNIENNLLNSKYNVLNEEHTKLVHRWLQKAQLDADTMNATMESQGSK